MADEYKRGYSKGYSAGGAAGRRKAEDAEAVRRVAERSVAAMQARNGVVGRCEDCTHWQRGVDQDGQRSEGVAWGVCAASRDHAWPWFDTGSNKPLVTCEAFGCLRYVPTVPSTEGNPHG
ncbi:MAG: hypothetical protein WC869_11760 [Phycisphaerae bacterium]|jgi:hypothetical protein